MKGFKKNFISLLMVMTLVLGFALPTVGNVYAADESNVTSFNKQYEEILKDVKFIFEEASSFNDGKLTINQHLLEEKYGVEMASYISIGLNRIYFEKNLAKNLKPNSYSGYRSLGFVDCMKGEIIGMIPGVDIYQLFSSGDLKAYIEGKAWGKVASIIAKQLIKFGLKSNVAGIVAQLGISAGKCAVWG